MYQERLLVDSKYAAFLRGKISLSFDININTSVYTPTSNALLKSKIVNAEKVWHYAAPSIHCLMFITHHLFSFFFFIFTLHLFPRHLTHSHAHDNSILHKNIYPQITVRPGSSDPPEKIFNIFASEYEVYTIH